MRRRIESAPNRNVNSADEGDEDAEADAAGEVVDLRADPQAGERDRSPAEQADDDHPGQQRAGERAVDALSPFAAAFRAASESGPARCRAGARRTARRCRMGRCASLSSVRSCAACRTLARIERVEQLRVSLVDHVALDLQRRRQLAGRLGEVVVEDRELLDLLDLRVFGVDAVDLLLDERMDRRVARERGDVLRAGRVRVRSWGSPPRRA